MIEYKVEGHTYSLSYKELREFHYKFSQMSDEDFIRSLPKVLHLAIQICFLKEIPGYLCLSDKGIIHELTHLLDEGTTTPLSEIRTLFDEQLKLI